MAWEGIRASVVEAYAPFLEEILAGRSGDIHSVHLIGSALTPDYDEKTSDINSIVVLHEMDLGFVEYLAPLGKRYRRKRVAAPLMMTPEYIRNSLDVFPVEFLDFRFIHRTVHGEDILAPLVIERQHLRLQCEREIKRKLIWLRQGYLSSLGDPRLLSERLSESITGYMPLFRAILWLLGKEPPVPRHDVVVALQEATGIESGIFEKMLLLRRKQIRLSKDELTASFEQYYRATERIGKTVDALPV